MEDTIATDADLGRLRLQLITRIAVGASLLAAFALAGLAFWLGPGETGSYTEIIAAYAISHARLDTAMLVGGLLLAGATALLAGLAALYASFRVAGPLYRMARNLEAARDALGPMPGIRRGDALQDTAAAMEAAFERLDGHHATVSGRLDALEAALDRGASADELARLWQETGEHIRRVRLD